MCLRLIWHLFVDIFFVFLCETFKVSIASHTQDFQIFNTYSTFLNFFVSKNLIFLIFSYNLKSWLPNAAKIKFLSCVDLALYTSVGYHLKSSKKIGWKFDIILNWPWNIFWSSYRSHLKIGSTTRGRQSWKFEMHKDV
jgi:hypothetical protein